MDDRRRQKRRHLVYYLQVNDAATQRPIGRMVDITTEGIMLCGSERFAPGRSYTLRMTLPEEVDGGKEIAFTARCVWSRRDVNPANWLAGFQIVDSDEERALQIRRLIRRLGFQD